MQGADFLFIRKTYGPQASQVKGLHPWNQMVIDHLSFGRQSLNKIVTAMVSMMSISYFRQIVQKILLLQNFLHLEHDNASGLSRKKILSNS